MDKVKVYDETNRGKLFSVVDEEMRLIQQGKLNLNGNQLRVIGINRKNKDGEPIVELYRAIGTLKKVEEEDKRSETSPDAKGVVNVIVDDGAMNISAWKKTSKDGKNQYVDLAVRPFDEIKKEYNPKDDGCSDDFNEFDDKVPF